MPTLPESRWVEAATNKLDEDAYFERIARGFDATVLFEFGGDGYLLTVEDGTITDLRDDPEYLAWDFAVRAPTETWDKVFAEVPPPQYNDLRGVWLQRDLDIEGDVFLAIQHWRPLKYVIETFGEATR